MMIAAKAARFPLVFPEPISASTASLRKAEIASGVESEVGKAKNLGLIHRNAAEDLGEIFTKPDLGQEALGLAEAVSFLHAPGINRHFLDGLDMSREPCQPMDRVLLDFDLVGAWLSAFAHPVARTASRAQSRSPSTAKWASWARSSSFKGSPFVGMSDIAAPQHATREAPMQCGFGVGRSDFPLRAGGVAGRIR